jgi:hypothetical protein
VSEDIAETGETFPVHGPMPFQKILGQGFDRLTDYDERPADRYQRLQVRPLESRLVPSGCRPPDPIDGGAQILKPLILSACH